METVLFSLPEADAPQIYVRAWTLCCFHSLISTPNLLEGADGSVGGQLRGDKEFPFHWRNQIWQSLEEGAVKRCFSGCGNGSVPGMNGKDRAQSAVVNGVTLASVILGLNRSATHIR